MKVVVLLLVIFMLMPFLVMADDEIPSDTSEIPIIIDTTDISKDSTVVIDSTSSDSITIDSTITDSMITLEEGEASFEEKYLEHQKNKRNTIPTLSVFDSLLTYFTSDRLNRKNDVELSLYHDAGDYFRFHPSFFVNEYQVTPMRKTIQPFGIGNSRLNFLFDGNQLQPFGHVPEPDGMVDINDIPTALDNEIYILPGPVGQIFGGSGSIASIVTRPKRPETYSPESALLADKGGYAYNYVRGRYSKKYNDGRNTNALIEYHNGEGSTANRQSDQYQYYGDFSFPLNDNYGLKFWGHLNDRDGAIVTRPDLGGTVLDQDKFDRTIKLSIARDNDERTTGYELGYQHIRQGSQLKGISDGSFNITGHGGFLKREWISGSKVLAVNIEGNSTEYDEGYNAFNRTNASSLLQIGWLKKTWRFAVSMGADWIEDYDLLPNGALVLFRNGDNSTVMLSAGYSERAPSMHELHLPYQRSSLYGSGAEQYVEQGNSELKSEKQMTGSLIYEYGSLDNRIGITITGGSVKDGIDWYNELISDTSGTYRKFEPVNNDFSFVNVLLQPRMKLKNYLTYVGGVSFNKLDYDAYDAKPYNPEYQFASGLELHYYWAQKLMRLFAYGEIVYVGPYDGYEQEDLDQEIVANVKLSFAFKDYKMHFVFQNVLGTQYQSREYNTRPGRFFYYGFTWNFLN
jgi:hypothetical protein